MTAAREPAGAVRRRGGRAARQAARRRPAADRRPYIRRNIGVFEVLDDEALAIIERNADTILAEVGMEFRDDPEILDIFRDAGADVSGERVRFERGMCRAIIQATAPAAFTQHARNPANSVRIGGNNALFCPSFGPPFVHDLDRGRRYATLEDFHNFVKLDQVLPAVHHSGGVVCEPVDVPVPVRHLDMAAGHLRYSDKPFMGAVTAPERAEDTVAMAKLVFGDDFVADNCCIYSVSNVNAPLVLDATMSGALKVYARHNQAVVVSPFILAGAMSPVTVAGTLAQLLAEVLGGLALAQLVRPGCPSVFGTFASAISMRSGAPTFGTPEGAQVIFGAAQLARRLGVPFHSVGALSASKIPDAQAAYESAATLLSSLLAGVNFIIHATGWLEGGLTMGYEKTIMDADVCGMLQRFAEGVDVSEAAQALDAVREVGPGGHYLGCAHTQAHFEAAFYRSTVADNNSYEQWSAEGGLDAARRANAIWKRLLEEYEPPHLDPGIAESLDDYVAQRKEALGASDA